MARHQWAADRLWRALIVPSNQAWQDALDVLADTFARARLFGANTIPSIAAVAGQQVSKTVFAIGRSTFTVRGNQASVG